MQKLGSIFIGFLIIATFAVYFVPGGIASKSSDGGGSFGDTLNVYAEAFLGRKPEPDFVPTGDPDDPESYLERGYYSHMSRGAILSLENGDPVFISDVLTGYQDITEEEQPARIVGYAEPEPCRLTPASPDNHIANAVVGHTKRYAGFYADQKQMRSSLMTQWQRLGRYSRAGPGAEPFQVSDLVVTYRDKPVHLVLTSSANFTIWNLQLAPEVEIARVTFIGGFQAIANLPHAVPVEKAWQFGKEDCDFQIEYPWFKDPFDDETANPHLPADLFPAEERREAHLEREAAYKAWFLKHFGIGPMERRAGWHNGPAALIGPIPEKPLEYRPMSASVLYVPAGKTIYAGRTSDTPKLYAAPEDE